MTDKEDRQGKTNTGKIGVLKPEDGNNETEYLKSQLFPPNLIPDN